MDQPRGDQELFRVLQEENRTLRTQLDARLAEVKQLNEELAEYRRVPPAQARYWPAATGLALRDWLLRSGYQPEAMSF